MDPSGRSDWDGPAGRVESLATQNQAHPFRGWCQEASSSFHRLGRPRMPRGSRSRNRSNALLLTEVDAVETPEGSLPGTPLAGPLLAARSN
jgi:hypothetical protein